MSQGTPVNGLGFAELVLAHLEKESARDGRDAHMNVAEAEKEIGINQPQILRAINIIRDKGYPVISKSTRRTWENDFKIPSSQSEYIEWRSKMTDDMKTLIHVLKYSDAAAKAKFGVDMPVQEFLF